jgi:threonine dehydrogenase-like Zn-dependent dehydrogenase
LRALLLGNDGSLTLGQAPLPAWPGECLIRVTFAGICGTDLQMLEGYAEFTGVPGHEFVGLVEDAPASDARWIGRRVVGEINVGCGTCERCASGLKEHCPHRTVVGIRDRSGTFAEFLSLPAANLHHVPDHVDDTAAVFVEPVAAACRILEQVAVNADTRVAVVGDGRLGNLIAQVLATRTSDLVLIGRREPKLSVARGLGLDARTIDGAVPGDYDLVVDATGRPDGLERALELVRPRGNNLILLYGNAIYDEVTTRSGKEKMLADGLAEIQNIMKTQIGEPGVEAVYFTSLIVQ